MTNYSYRLAFGILDTIYIISFYYTLCFLLRSDFKPFGNDLFLKREEEDYLEIYNTWKFS